MVGHEGLDIELNMVDHHGRKVRTGYYYGDGPVTKAAFFNVSPGKYVITALSKDGYWLASQTVLVYSETVPSHPSVPRSATTSSQAGLTIENALYS